MTWNMSSANHTANSAGLHLVYASNSYQSKPYMPITFFRGIPCQIDSYSYSDPYSDATAQITFPQITELDDLDEVWWCREFSQIDIYWAPASATKLSDYDIPATNPDTGKPGWWINVEARGNPIWEGHTYSYRASSDGAVVQCQGAMFAVDRYVSKPTYPPRPQTAESLIRKAFNTSPTHLKSFNPEHIYWPAGWSKTYSNTTLTEAQFNNYTVDGVKVGENWSGFATRNTGSWGKMLTGFVSEMLGVMYTPDDCGVTEGNQWTCLMGSGRQPYLTVRDRFKAPDFTFYAGTPGTLASLSRDALATSSVFYGSGQGTDGTKWSNTAISSDGSETQYQPVAYLGDHYPYDNPNRPKGLISGETMIQFGTGIGLDQALIAGEKMLRRDYDPGWVGDIELQIDPLNLSGVPVNKWTIKPGMCVQVKNYAGLATLNLHIAQVQCFPLEGKVTLSVDSKFRDLLTLEEVSAKIRDPLTPAKMLRVGERSGILEDHLAPWDYEAGSGLVPYEARPFFKEMPNTIRFPWTDWLREKPPRDFSEYYIKVAAHKEHSKLRWNACSFLTASAGTIRLSQFVCVDEDGEIVEIPFHVSIHDVNMLDDAKIEIDENASDDGIIASDAWWNYIPRDVAGTKEMFSPLLNDKMWQRTDSSGASLEGTTYPPPPSMIVGWGTYAQPAGYSPGRLSDGSPPSGLLLDESTWSFDNVGGSIERLDPRGGSTNNLTKTKLVCTIYAKHTEPVYFIGRFFRNEPGY